MNKRFIVLSLLCLFAALVLWSPPASANHPVKEIPVRVLRANDPAFAAWTTTDHVMRQVEFANRVYANANIKLKFDPVHGFSHITDPDFACWWDDPADDAQFVNAYAAYYDHEMIVAVPLHHSEGDGASCVTGCNTTLDCCPTKRHFQGYGMVCNDDAYVSCDPNTPPTPTRPHQCIPSNYTAEIPDCFNAICGEDACALPRSPSDPRAEGIRFRPMFNDGISKLAHEVGHLFGLRHPWEAPFVRCYDRTQGTVTETCTAQPAACAGAFGGCPANQPWRNIMAAHTCQATFAGQLNTTSWNESLSVEQINIVSRALDEWWDQVVTAPNGGEYLYGGYEMMQMVTATTPWEYRGRDTWNTIGRNTTGESGWTRGNVKIKAADVNGDGRMDAIVSAASGPHPNTTLWLRGASGALSYSQQLLGFGGVNVNVAVGNVMGDGSDDVLVSYGSLTYIFKGQYGAPTMLLVAAPAWGTTVQVYVGNFGGQHQLPVGQGGVDHNFHQVEATNGNFTSISYDDVLVVKSSGADLYYGASTFDTVVDLQTNLYSTIGTSGAWAANLGLDYHDELVIRNASGLHVIKGADTFAFGDEHVLWSYAPTDLLRVSLGNLTMNHYGDMLVTSPSGTRLYAGQLYGPVTSSWYRSDLVSSNTKHVTADFVRAGNDDVTFLTTSGSWLYAGAKTNPWLTSGVWSDAGYTYSNAEWFGTQ